MKNNNKKIDLSLTKKVLTDEEKKQLLKQLKEKLKLYIVDIRKKRQSKIKDFEFKLHSVNFN